MRIETRGAAGSATLLARHDLVEDLVAADHAELQAGALLDRPGALLQVAHFRVERVVARLELRVGLALLRDASLELPHARPAALAEPQRILQREDEDCQGGSEILHLIW